MAKGEVCITCYGKGIINEDSICPACQGTGIDQGWSLD